MSVNSIKEKEKIVADMVDKLSRAQGVAFLDYRGLTVAEVTELRNNFREQGVEYRVMKNKMLRRAAEQLGYEELIPHLEGPTAVAFGYDDPVAPAKIMSAFIKKVKKTEIKCGIVEGKVIDAIGVKALADLPPREVLIARILGSITSPISGLARVIDAIREKQAAA
ncbi:MAG: 50S ribosomal protein L10 [Christensenellales bacterium]